MKYLILLLLFLASAHEALAEVYVQPYLNSDGTYTRGYYRSRPDSSTFNNYSSRGNPNPYTGERGFRDPYRGFQLGRGVRGLRW